MKTLVVGSVALDTLETPRGRREDILGGAASFFATAASYFARPHLVAVVGDDFAADHVEFLRGRGIDLDGLQRATGRTFRWGGRYSADLTRRETLFTELGVFADFHPRIPEAYRDAELVFLANIDPALQLEVLDQVRAPRLVACDTMNFWIEHRQPELLRTLARVDLLVINEEEARQLSGEASLARAARRLLGFGPRVLVIKRGDAGAVVWLGEEVFVAPALPLDDVVDPTGAGDAFGGGLIGYLSRNGAVTPAALRRAALYGNVMGSFSVEDFGLARLAALRPDEIEGRAARMERLIAL